jgi:flavodoxin
MRKSVKLFSVLAALGLGALCLTACHNKNQNKEEMEENSPKYLVLYYSQTGTTKEVAEELQRRMGADIDSIQLEEPYPDDYDATIERSREEMEKGIHPKVKPLHCNVSDYDVIFIGYPVWFGTYAMPVSTVLSENDFSGKKVVPFCTFGSGGLESSSKDLAAALPNSEIALGYGVRTVRLKAMPDELNRFLIENGYVEGEVTALADYSESQPCTDEEKAIFETATSGYKFPLGTPVTVGKRSTDKGVDYKYEVNCTSHDGTPATATIYVTVGNEEGATPEFTRVDRH